MARTTTSRITDDFGSAASAVAWPAIFGGAFAAVATTLVLVVLGTGLGLASVSPFTENPSLTSLTIITVSWMIIVQWLSSAIGGYLAGRLRTKSTVVHTDEVFFRDTAHGFLTWVIATLFVALFMASTLTLAAGGTLAAQDDQEQSIAAANSHNQYTLDSLFRSDRQKSPNAGEVRIETARILNNGLMGDQFPDNDRAYLTYIVSREAGVGPTEASARVNRVISEAQTTRANELRAAEQARKVSSSLSVFTALSMVIGAFIASVAAAYGGRLRDSY